MAQLETKISFFGGLNTIGGVHIVVGRGNTAIVFDLGLSVRNMFNESVRPGAKSGVRSYLLSRSAPPVLNLYKEDAVGGLAPERLKQLWGAAELPSYGNLHAFVSHIHQDHMALLPFVNEKVPVYMHKDAHSVYKAIVAAGEYADTSSEIRPVEDLQTIDLGDGLSIQVIEVDHDTPGVSGLLIRDGEHTIAFTADWRRHGRHPYRLDRFAKLAREAGAQLLITEGTTLRPDTLWRREPKRQEADVARMFQTTMEQSKGLVYVNILARNVERVADIILAAKNAGRKLVMDESTAVLWQTAIAEGIEALHGNPALEEHRDVIRLMRVADPGAKELGTPLPYQAVDFDEIAANKEAYAVFLTHKQLPRMAELETLGDMTHESSYVHADGNPLSDRDETLRYWLSYYNVQYIYCATGGHAASYEISDLIEAVSPKVVIPLHSNHPTLVDSRGAARFYPMYGETLPLAKLIGTPVPSV